MQQLSRPYQIALGAMIVLAIAWFIVLKPAGSESVAAPPPITSAPGKLPGQQGLEGAVKKANGAAATSKASAAATRRAADAASGITSSTSAGAAPPPSKAAAAGASTGAATPAIPAEPADFSAPVLRDVRRGKVAVLLFFGPGGSDDAAVRRALLTVQRHAGRVTVRAVPIAKVARYAALTEGVDIAQSPTVLVVGSDRRARSLVGFVDTRSIDQLVEDVGGRAFTAKAAGGYKARIENLCAVVAPTLAGTALDAPDLQERLVVVRDGLADARSQARKGGVPKRYRAFHTAFTANLALTVDAYAAVGAAIGAGTNAAAAYAPFKPRVATSVARVETAARRVGLAPGC